MFSMYVDLDKVLPHTLFQLHEKEICDKRMYSIGHEKSDIMKKVSNVSVIYHGGLTCCYCVLNYF
jgi:hypothetical protein